MNCNLFLWCFFGISTFLLNSIVEAVVGGQIAMFNDFRYHVTILVNYETPKCGGGIIEENFIITAAHCVIRYNGEAISKLISVRTGTKDLGVRVVQAQTIFVPMTYGPDIPNSPGNIAILKLKGDLDVKKYGLMTLYFPRNKHKSEDNQTAKFAGIGWYRVPEGVPEIAYYSDDKLRYAEAVVRTHNECKNDHRDKNVAPQHLCARVKQHINGTERRGVCHGDEGGPLVRGGKYVIGILSLIENGCTEKYGSGIYIRASHYRTLKQNAVGYKGPEDQYKEEKSMRIIPIHV